MFSTAFASALATAATTADAFTGQDLMDHLYAVADHATTDADRSMACSLAFLSADIDAVLDTEDRRHIEQVSGQIVDELRRLARQV